MAKNRIKKKKDLVREIKEIEAISNQVAAMLDELRLKNASLAQSVYDAKSLSITHDQALKIVDKVGEGKLIHALVFWNHVKWLLTQSRPTFQTWIDLIEGREVNTLD